MAQTTHPAHRSARYWLVAVGMLALAIIVIAAWFGRGAPSSSSPTSAPTPTTPTSPPPTTTAAPTPTEETSLAPLPPPDLGVQLAQMSVTTTPLTLDLPAGALLKSTDPLQPLLSVSFAGRKQVSDHLAFSSEVFELRDRQLHEIPALSKHLEERFAGSQGTVVCDMDAYDAVVVAKCRLPMSAQLSAVFFDTASGESFATKDEQLLAATSLGSGRHIAIFAPPRPPQTPPAITVRHYAADGSARWSQDFLLADEQILTQVAAQLDSWRLPPSHLLIPTITGGKETPWKVVDVQTGRLIALSDVEGYAQMALWPAAGALQVTCDKQEPHAQARLLAADFHAVGQPALSAHVLQGVGAPLGVRWCDGEAGEAFAHLAAATSFADLQAALPTLAALGETGSLEGEPGGQFVMQILPGGELLTAPVAASGYPMKAALPPAFASVEATCDVPSIVVNAGARLLCVDNDAGARRLLGFQPDSPTPLFSLPIDPGLDPSWVRVGTDTWVLNTASQLFLME